MVRRLAILLCGLFAAGVSLHASTITLDFSGTCADCTGAGPGGAVTAELVLNELTPGALLDSDDFVSFTYGGSNVVGGFAITSSDIDNGGAFTATFAADMTDAAAASVSVQAGSILFSSHADGSWDVITDYPTSGPGYCTCVPDDRGVVSTWQQPPVAAVPEPATLATLATGVGMLGLLGWAGKLY